MFLQVSLVISYIYISRQSLSVSFRVKEKAMSICIRYNTRFIMENPTALKNTTALPTRYVIVPQCPSAIINLQVPQYIQCHAQCIGNDFFHTRLGTDVYSFAQFELFGSNQSFQLSASPHFCFFTYLVSVKTVPCLYRSYCSKNEVMEKGTSLLMLKYIC